MLQCAMRSKQSPTIVADVKRSILIADSALCIVGSLLPAWGAVRLIPADALRRM
jgi:ABC-type lipoprotein release transport system permease subunit